MLRLKENPMEWIKFTAVMGLSVNLPVWVLWWRGTMPLAVGLACIGLALLAIIAAFIRPRWFRGFYRWGMSFSYHMGMIMGKVLLTVFFFIFVTPLGLFLRLLGKDLLRLKMDPKANSHWHPAKTNREFDRMF